MNGTQSHSPVRPHISDPSSPHLSSGGFWWEEKHVKLHHSVNLWTQQPKKENTKRKEQMENIDKQSAQCVWSQNDNEGVGA